MRLVLSDKALLAAVLAIAACIAPQVAGAAQGGERGGKEVVESTCASCHATGAQGAPKIGDSKAWRKRAAQGLTSLTQHALQGIRKMPAHGGNPELSDLEVARAVAYMVNRSGGRWVEPASLKDLAAERSGPQVFRQQCSKCHQEGVGGAPRIGDVGAWTPRLKEGLDNAVRTAIRGHGGMPPRGDRADLTDAEVRNAVLYMINPGSAQKKGTPARAAALPSTLYKSVGGLDVHLGLVPAEALRVFPEGSVERSMHGGVPRGSGYYHVNVSLFDGASKAPIADAEVALRVEQLDGSGVSRTLEPVTFHDAPSYGTYVRLRRNTRYVVIVRVGKPGSPRSVEARFEHKLY